MAVGNVLGQESNTQLLNGHGFPTRSVEDGTHLGMVDLLVEVDGVVLPRKLLDNRFEPIGQASARARMDHTP